MDQTEYSKMDQTENSKMDQTENIKMDQTENSKMDQTENNKMDQTENNKMDQTENNKMDQTEYSKMDQTEYSKITFLFESGTSQDEMLEYAEVLRKQLAGKISEDQLEYLISDYVSSISNCVFVCDSCKCEISCQTNNSCKKCDLKFDLCEYCQSKESLVKCPLGFGCSDSVDNTKLFIPKSKNEPLEKYSAFGETYVATKSRIVNIPSTEILSDFDECNHYLSSVIYISEKEVSYKLLEDMWLYFRTKDPESLEKYGKPRCPVVELPSWKMYQTYQQFAECFSMFISLDDSVNDNVEIPLMMRIIYPNGDTFMVKRLYGELITKVGSLFSTFFIQLSDYVNKGEVTDYNIECFREKLEKKAGKTVEELNENGQVLLISFSVGKDKKLSDTE